MYHAIGMSVDDEEVAKTLAKVDRALFMTPCPYIKLGIAENKFESEIKGRTSRYIKAYKESNILFIEGEGSDF